METGESKYKLESHETRAQAQNQIEASIGAHQEFDVIDTGSHQNRLIVSNLYNDEDPQERKSSISFDKIKQISLTYSLQSEDDLTPGSQEIEDGGNGVTSMRANDEGKTQPADQLKHQRELGRHTQFVSTSQIESQPNRELPKWKPSRNPFLACIDDSAREIEHRSGTNFELKLADKYLEPSEWPTSDGQFCDGLEGTQLSLTDFEGPWSRQRRVQQEPRGQRNAPNSGKRISVILCDKTDTSILINDDCKLSLSTSADYQQSTTGDDEYSSSSSSLAHWRDSEGPSRRTTRRATVKSAAMRLANGQASYRSNSGAPIETLGNEISYRQAADYRVNANRVYRANEEDDEEDAEEEEEEDEEELESNDNGYYDYECNSHCYGHEEGDDYQLGVALPPRPRLPRRKQQRASAGSAVSGNDKTRAPSPMNKNNDPMLNENNISNNSGNKLNSHTRAGRDFGSQTTELEIRKLESGGDSFRDENMTPGRAVSQRTRRPTTLDGQRRGLITAAGSQVSPLNRAAVDSSSFQEFGTRSSCSLGRTNIELGGASWKADDTPPLDFMTNVARSESSLKGRNRQNVSRDRNREVVAQVDSNSRRSDLATDQSTGAYEWSARRFEAQPEPNRVGPTSSIYATPVRRPRRQPRQPTYPRLASDYGVDATEADERSRHQINIVISSPHRARRLGPERRDTRRSQQQDVVRHQWHPGRHLSQSQLELNETESRFPRSIEARMRPPSNPFSGYSEASGWSQWRPTLDFEAGQTSTSFGQALQNSRPLRSPVGSGNEGDKSADRKDHHLNVHIESRPVEPDNKTEIAVSRVEDLDASMRLERNLNDRDKGSKRRKDSLDSSELSNERERKPERKSEGMRNATEARDVSQTSGELSQEMKPARRAEESQTSKPAAVSKPTELNANAGKKPTVR